MQVLRIAGSRFERCGLWYSPRHRWWWLCLHSKPTGEVNNEWGVEVGIEATFDILRGRPVEAQVTVITLRETGKALCSVLPLESVGTEDS